MDAMTTVADPTMRNRCQSVRWRHQSLIVFIDVNTRAQLLLVADGGASVCCDSILLAMQIAPQPGRSGGAASLS